MARVEDPEERRRRLAAVARRVEGRGDGLTGTHRGSARRGSAITSRDVADHAAVAADRRADDRLALGIEPAHPELADGLAVELGDLDVQQDLARAGNRPRG